MKVDVMLSGSVLDAARRAQELEQVGVDGVFTFENAHDVFFPLVAAAPVCSLDLLTNVAMAFPRSPVHLAHAAYDLHALSGGRFRLGLGSQVRAHIEKRYGSVWGKPVQHMRELVLATQAVLRAWQEGRALRFEGTYTRHTLMTPIFDPGPNPYGVPKVLVGALGPKMLHMAAEVADGVLVMPFNSGRHMRNRTMPAIETGLTASGRGRSDIELTAEVIVSVGRNEEELAKANGVRFLLAFYGSTPAYKSVLDVEGWGDLQPVLNTMSKRGEWTEMADLIDDEMVSTLAVRGSPSECAAQIASRFGHCDRICAYFPGYDASDELVAEFVHALKAQP
jgi:probable F420-dependent oxidoreductase